MADHYLRKYGVEATLDFELYDTDGASLQTGAAHAAGDTNLMKDEGPEGATTNAFADEGRGYSLVLTATEMEAARVVVYVVDQTSPKAWLDRVLVVETYGDASAQHAFDLGAASVDVGSIATGAVDADALAADAATEIADATLKRGVDNVEATADADSVAALVLARFHSSISGGTWDITRTDDSTPFDSKTVATDASADPVTGVSG
jgi:hypothetical protein